jgi:hypothetical protein
MNRALPPGDCGHRGADSRWASGHAGIVPGARRLVGRTAATAGRHGSVTAVAPVWTPFPSLGLMPQPRRPGRNVGARSREAGHSGATSAVRCVGI